MARWILCPPDWIVIERARGSSALPAPELFAVSKTGVDISARAKQLQSPQNRRETSRLMQRLIPEADSSMHVAPRATGERAVGMVERRMALNGDRIVQVSSYLHNIRVAKLTIVVYFSCTVVYTCTAVHACPTRMETVFSPILFDRGPLFPLGKRKMDSTSHR